ncbi:DUF721 domain-containing protein [Vibrio renipiscarius]|uniref:DUF721 domain-containing protein n=1 Tax=Vibrio renipiscarius TaxID=1461322 RepID=A0A0C2NL06_9VIBR|nr:DciA family protein [Vibrio renipiscarius]KII79894.1 hypothetical protein OJ16_07770 [Vibrio renipiscarius]KII80131.1 hypothetical protein PL18_05965 [Vibrio renipiscarius]
MRDHRPTLSNDIISDSRFADLQKHAKEIIAINDLLKDILPKHTVEHCRAANVRDGQLVLEVASAAMKMKLSYDRLYILSQLRNQGFARLIAIDVQINPELYRSQKTQKPEAIKPREPISEVAAEYLQGIAENAPPKIKARLESLAKLAQQKKGQ